MSGGRLHEPEWFDPYDITRLTASIGFDGAVASRPLTATLAWGQNREFNGFDNSTTAICSSGTFARRRASSFYGRAEDVDEADLRARLPSEGFTHPHVYSDVAALTLGYVRDLPIAGRHAFGVGGDVTVYRMSPDLLEPTTAARTPFTCSCAGGRRGVSGARPLMTVASSACTFAICIRAVTTGPANADGTCAGIHVPRRPVGTARRHRARCHRRRAGTGARNRDRAPGPPDPRRVPDRQDRRRRAGAAARRAEILRRDRPRRRPTPVGWERYTPSDGVLLLKRDLLDQQIIDVHGRKVVRVNDVELDSTPVNSHLAPERRRGRRRRPRRHPPARRRASSRRSRCARCSRRSRRA